MKFDFWLERVRADRPLVHNITNLVVNNIAANALLAMGASPVMAYAPEEVGDMARIAQALSLNMGTLTSDIVRSMKIAGKAANDAGVPVIFDPVGVGATPYRTEVAGNIPEDVKLTVLRGNAGEMSVFLGLAGEVKGVDSLGSHQSLPLVMKEYAKKQGVVMIATGVEDYVTDGEQIWRLGNGHPLLSHITGSGCMLTALLGAFVGVAPKHSNLQVYAEACVAAVTTYNVAAEIAAQESAGPGTFQARLFDSLYKIDGETVKRMAHVELVSEHE
ncbi:hydroxyethylthiazole kinase [Alicyclobacillus dauci]|uniref:Hydroxyethylthiazole kinase n=1 Tax=Alicyclobacillus dauci TaxID=1475485 RepID=A0ABY6YZZ0_9BACL|nr:hydroxyethylthiazole kinase [Alicyclobacillus dauci]WAH36151.1 hydroxyethylthiazole kinase [Alicyclobacillus dauci]